MNRDRFTPSSRLTSRGLLVGVALVGVLAAGCGQSLTGTAVAASGAKSAGPSSAPSAQTASGSTAATAPTSSGGTVSCAYTATPNDPAPAGHDEGLPPGNAPASGTVTLTLHANQGDIPLTMPRAKAPCTVASFAFLAGKGFFNSSPCHRLTTNPALKVLQCGDPTGAGTGGPGYTIPDENPTDLPQAQDGQGSVYARGTLAMANTGQPHSGGSQFFLVYADSELPPQYAVFGTIGAPGLAVLDKIAAAGVAAGNGPPDDGSPNLATTIASVS